MTELFNEKQWVGEFFVPDQYKNRFPGRIDYSPESGVVFSYVITGHKVPADSDVVFGVLDTGEQCTLVGKFRPKNSRFTLRQGFYTQSGEVRFDLLLIGNFVDHDELFCDINFSLTNMQEFFFPESDKDLLKYSKSPLLELKTSYGKISIGNNAQFRFLPKDITSQIYSINNDALEQLKIAFEGIREKYPDNYFMMKDDISYSFSIKLDAGETIRNLYKHVSDIANLFSILMYKPIYPEYIDIKRNGNDSPTFMKVYPSLLRNKRTIELCTNYRSHFSLPISNRNINLSEVLTAWLISCRNHSIIISSIQYKTGFKSEHDLHGEIVLYATQFESISSLASIKNNKRYQYPLDTYSCERIRKGTEKIFTRAGERDVGKGISRLRNDIAHIGKPKKLLDSLSIRDLGYISQYLHVTIIGYILSTLGVDKNIVGIYQERFAPDT